MSTMLFGLLVHSQEWETEMDAIDSLCTDSNEKSDGIYSATFTRREYERNIFYTSALYLRYEDVEKAKHSFPVKQRLDLELILYILGLGRGLKDFPIVRRHPVYGNAKFEGWLVPEDGVHFLKSLEYVRSSLDERIETGERLKQELDQLEVWGRLVTLWHERETLPITTDILNSLRETKFLVDNLYQVIDEAFEARMAVFFFLT